MNTKKITGWVMLWVGFAVALGLPLSVCAQDAYEPDNNFASARTIGNWQTQNRSIHAAGNEDWVTFTLVDGGARNVIVEILGGTSGRDTQLWLYGPSRCYRTVPTRYEGVQIAYDDDSGPGSFSRIFVPTLGPGVYTIKITDYGNNSVIPLYQLRTRWTPVSPAADAYETDNVAAQASPITRGSVQTRSIHVAGDRDWASFTVGPGGAEDLAVVAAGDRQLKVWVYNAAMQAVGYADGNRWDEHGCAPAAWSEIDIAALAAGNYFIRVQETSNARMVNSYTLDLRWTTPGGDRFEPDDSAGAAKDIDLGTTQNRSIHTVGNVDWIRLRVGSGGARDVQLTTAGAAGDTQMWLYRGNGTLVAYDDNSGVGDFSSIGVAALAAGTYYIRVQEYGNDGTIAAYTLHAAGTQGIAPDAYEADNTAGAARAIGQGQTQNRTIHAAGNVDWVRFTVPRAGARKVMLETNGDAGDTQMWVFRGSNGARIGYDDDSGNGNFSQVFLYALSPGSYLVRIQENGNNGTIPAYTLRATWTSP